MVTDEEGVVYLIHFEKKLGHAQHYIGFTQSIKHLPSRFKHHQTGNGSRLLNALNQKEIPYKIVRIWEGVDRAFERKLKNWKKSRLLCPECLGKLSRRGLNVSCSNQYQAFPGTLGLEHGIKDRIVTGQIWKS